MTGRSVNKLQFDRKLTEEEILLRKKYSGLREKKERVRQYELGLPLQREVNHGNRKKVDLKMSRKRESSDDCSGDSDMDNENREERNSTGQRVEKVKELVRLGQIKFSAPKEKTVFKMRKLSQEKRALVGNPPKLPTFSPLSQPSSDDVRGSSGSTSLEQRSSSSSQPPSRVDNVKSSSLTPGSCRPTSSTAAPGLQQHQTSSHATIRPPSSVSAAAAAWRQTLESDRSRLGKVERSERSYDFKRGRTLMKYSDSSEDEN